MIKLAVLAVLAISVSADNCALRPFWNVLHFGDSIDVVNQQLGQNTPNNPNNPNTGHFNGIHSYINFDSYDNPSVVHHDPVCDGISNNTQQQRFDQYLDFVRRLTEPGNPNYRSNIVLLQFEVNLVKLDNSDQYRAGENFAVTLANRLYGNVGSNYGSVVGSGSQAWVVIQIDSTNDDPFVRGFTDALRNGRIAQNLVNNLNDKVGWNIHQDYASVGTEYRYFQYYNINNIIFSSGKDSCVPMNYRNLMLRIAVRDQYIDVNDIVVNKVFIWYPDRTLDIRNALILRVDGIVTNRPNNVWAVLNEPRFKNEFKLAALSDNPFAKYPLLETHTK